jgi:hypothetical protein
MAAQGDGVTEGLPARHLAHGAVSSPITCPESVVLTAYEFIVGPLLDNPQRVGG